jgi:hypothetical protein
MITTKKNPVFTVFIYLKMSFFFKRSFAFASSASIVSGCCGVAFCNEESGFKKPFSHFMQYESVAASAYAVLNRDEDYNNLGQVSRDEVAMTVLPNAYTQIGVLLPSGVRELFNIEIDEEEQETKSSKSKSSTATSLLLPRALNENDVFVDIGSGVGNINLQVFCETPVKKSIGIELLPSRNAYADLARTICALFFSDLFGVDGTRELEFITGDFADKKNKEIKSAFNEATVIFSHSWMFPEELMVKFGERVLEDAPNVDLIISSRQVPQLDERWIVSRIELQADWNEKSPFFVYQK